MNFDPKNPKAGIYDDLPIGFYHGPEMAHIVSHSYLSRLNDCPAKGKVPTKVTPAMIFGRCLHKYALEGLEAFLLDCAVMPDFPCPDGQNPKGWHLTKIYKEKVAQFQADNLGKEIINCEDFETIKAMTEAMKINPVVRTLLADGFKEVSIIWQDEETGIWCKARPDGICPKTSSIADLKKVSEGGAREHAFQTIINKRTYQVQMAMCLKGLLVLHELGIVKEQYDIATLIAVEDAEPYKTQDWTLDQDFIMQGHAEFMRLLRIEKACREQNFWPNYEPTNLMNLRYKEPGHMLKPGYLSEEKKPWETFPPEQ